MVLISMFLRSYKPLKLGGFGSFQGDSRVPLQGVWGDTRQLRSRCYDHNKPLEPREGEPRQFQKKTCLACLVGPYEKFVPWLLANRVVLVLGFLLAGHWDFNVLVFNSSQCSIGVESLTFRRGSEVGPVYVRYVLNTYVHACVHMYVYKYIDVCMYIDKIMHLCICVHVVFVSTYTSCLNV